jgi:4-amino-4-deoxy-L-arabinose transferase-like glycosyltransferase
MKRFLQTLFLFLRAFLLFGLTILYLGTIVFRGIWRVLRFGPAALVRATGRPAFWLGLSQLILVTAGLALAIHTQFHMRFFPDQASLVLGLQRYGIAACLLLLGLLLRRLPEDPGPPEREARNSRPTRRRVVIGMAVMPWGILFILLALQGFFRSPGRLPGMALLLFGFCLTGLGYAWLAAGKRGADAKGTDRQAPPSDNTGASAGPGDTAPRAAAMVRPPDSEDETAGKETSPDNGKRKGWITFAGVVPGIVLALGLCLYAGRMWDLGQRTWWAFLPWGLGLLAGVLAFAWVDWRNGWRPLRRYARPAWWEWVLLLGILLLAAHFRLHRLTEFPEGIWIDEAVWGMESRRVLENHLPYSPVTSIHKNPSLSVYTTVPFFYFLGPSVFSVRLPIVLWSLAGVAGLFFLARLLFGRTAAFVSTFFMAAMYWHVVFSRFNMANVLTPALAVWTFYFFFRGQARKNWLDHYISGVFLGLGLHAYQSSYFAVFVFAVVAAHRFFFHRGSLSPGFVGRVLTAVLASVLLYIPAGVYARKHPGEAARRVRQTAIWKFQLNPDGSMNWENLEEELKNPNSELRRKIGLTVWKHMLFFNYTGDWILRHGVPNIPRVDRLTGALFVLGLSLAFLFATQSRYFFLIVLWFFALLPGMISLPFEAPQSARSVLAIPAVALLAALPVRGLLGVFRKNLGRFGFLIALAAATTAGAWVARENYRLYFDVQMQRSDVWRKGYTGIETKITRILGDLPEDWVIFSRREGLYQRKFLGVLPQHERLFLQYRDLPPSEVPAGDVAYVLDNSRQDIPEDYWKSLFGSGNFTQYVNYLGEPVCYLFHVDGETVRSLKGVRAEYRIPGSATEPIETRQETPSFAPPEAWRSGPGPVGFRWSGSLYTSQTGEYRFRFTEPVSGQLKIDGTVTGEEPVPLAAGWHAFEALGEAEPTSGSGIEWSLPGQAGFTPIRREYLFARGLPEHGLMGVYYRGNSWSSISAYRQVDPAIDFFWEPRPPGTIPDWYGRWMGYLQIDRPGQYRFRLEGPSPVVVKIDGETVIDGGKGRRAATVTLEAGRRSLDVWYRRGGPGRDLRLQLMWIPPGGKRFTVVPYQLLSPFVRYNTTGTVFAGERP